MTGSSWSRAGERTIAAGMPPSRWIDVALCVLELALAIVAMSRAGRAPVARPLGLFCVCVATWSAAGLVYRITGHAEWTLVDHALSPLSAPLALDVALSFDGRRRALRALLGTAYALCGALGAVALVALVVPDLRAFIGSRGWNVWLLCMGIPTMAFALVSLVAHLQRSVDRIEEERTRLVLAAFAIATILGSTDVLTPLAPFRETAGGRFGLLVATLAMALVSLRFAWFDDAGRVRRCTYAVAAAGVALLVYVAVFGFADASASGLILGTVAVTSALIVVSRRWAVDAAQQKERVARLASLGRFSAQIAHDIKNPLSALKGAAQLLRDDVAVPGESTASRPGPEPVALVDLMLEQIDRITRVVDTYGRLARIEVVRAPIDVNAVVREVVALQALAPAKDVVLQTTLADDLPTCDADRDMICSILENLVRNALEASTSGGSIAVRTERPRGEEPLGVVVVVEDDGVGMDPKTRERAFDDFFTTKPAGSGLGLAFVQRVVHAHGGDVTLTSSAGHGTVVLVRLPVS